MLVVTRPDDRDPPPVDDVGVKRCSKCGEEKDLEEFPLQAACAGGRRPECKACRRAYRAEFFSRPENQHHRRSDYQKRKARGRAHIDALKAGPCTDCGGCFPPVAMQFDHVRGDKVADVSDLVLQALATIDGEIAKCELVCANCHAVRTQIRALEISEAGVGCM